MIINLDYSEWWAERLARSNKGWGEASRTPREICAHFWCLQMCAAVKRLASLEGPRDRGAQSRCCPAEAVPLSRPDTNCSISKVIQHSFQKSKPFVADTCLLSVFYVVSHIPLLDFSVIFGTWLDFLGVLQHFLSVHSSPLCLRSPRSVPGCSNKYDKWGYRCLQNELWSESLWCLTLLMKYLDKSMYSHFVLRKNTLLLNTFFFVIVKCVCKCICVFLTFFLTFIPHGRWQCVLKAAGLSLRVVKRPLSRLCNREMNFLFYTHADCGHTHLLNIQALFKCKYSSKWGELTA